MKTANLFKIFTLFLAIGISSCSTESTDGDGDGGGSANGLVLTASKTRVYNFTLVTFTVNNGSSNVTTDAVISVDGTPITGNSFTMSGLGTKSVTAVVGTENTNSLNVTVIDPSYSTKVLIEDFTGAGCGWCPRVSRGIVDVHNAPEGDDVITVAIHNPVFGPDPMTFGQRLLIENQLGVGGSYPTAFINRNDEWNAVSNHAMSVSQPINLLGTTKSLGLAINSSLSGNSVNATVKVGFDLDQTGLKLVVFLLENNYIYPQTNYTNNWGGVSTITNFEHDDVLRASFTDLLGNVIPSDQQIGGSEYSASLSVLVPSGVNTADMDIVAFVVDSANNVVNVQKAAVGTDKDFD